MNPKSTSKATKPTRPRTAYNLYLHDTQRNIREELGRKISYTEVSKLVAARWRKIDDQEKAHYAKLAIQDKRRFALEMVQWKMQQESSPSQQPEQPKRVPSKPDVYESKPVQTAKYQQPGTEVFPIQMQQPTPQTMQPQSIGEMNHHAISGFLNQTPDAQRKLQMLFDMMDSLKDILKNTNQGNDMPVMHQGNPQGNDHAGQSWSKGGNGLNRRGSLLLNRRGSLHMAQQNNQNGAAPLEEQLNGFNPEDVPFLEELFGLQNESS